MSKLYFFLFIAANILRIYKMKVFIIGPNFYNFISATKNAFASQGWDVRSEAYDNPVHPFRGYLKLKHKLSREKEKIREKNRLSYQPYIKEKYDEDIPDLVFILNGDMICTGTLDYFRERSKIVVWLFDSLDKLPSCREHIDHTDFLFCYDMEDVIYYKEKGKKASFLPQACDSAIYKPLQGINKDIDIYFAGNLYLSQKRKQLIKAVINTFPDKKILVHGKIVLFVKKPLKWIFLRKRKIYKNKNIDGAAVNKFYNRSKVVLNIHNEQQKNGANPKVFEICGVGTYQVCDANQYIESLFPNGEVGLYHNENEMIKCIREALTHDCSKQAKAAQEIVLSAHTFTKRIQELLKIVYSK